MKYQQRQNELPYLMEIFADMGLTMIPFKGAPFEGQAELKWFHGGMKAICGYGFRSTRHTFRLMEKLFADIYGAHGMKAPELLVVPLESEDYYHLDVAMLEFDDSKCIVHKRAFSPASIKSIRKFLGESNVHVIDVSDSFCLNAVIDGDSLICHTVTKELKTILEDITGKHVKQVDTSEFEKSGGSVRCMTLDIFE